MQITDASIGASAVLQSWRSRLLCIFCKCLLQHEGGPQVLDYDHIAKEQSVISAWKQGAMG